MQSQETFYITTPIYYVNAAPHLGTAYTTLLADVRARFERRMGKRVLFLTGLDEHGEKVAQSAAAHDMTPQDWCDSMEGHYHELWNKLNISHDDFIRTTQPRHIACVQELFEKLKADGYLYEGEYDGWYCVPDETYFTETQVRHYNEEQGDENAHNCPDCGRPLQRIKETSWFFKLSAFEQKLLDYYEAHPDFIQPQIRRNEIESFVRSGLKDLSISRTAFDWGIPLPFAPDHVAYVWVDALINYWTAAQSALKESDGDLQFWPAQYHLVGKDIIRFHAAIWPALLMAAGLDLPKHIFVHGFLLVKGEKMSKSRGNAMSPYELIDIFGVDAYRYYFMTDVNPGADGSISIERMAQVYNADLANSWGNLISRTLNMVTKYCEGKVPEVKGDLAASELAAVARDVIDPYIDAMQSLDYPRAKEAVATLVDAANLYVDQKAPWGLAKDPERFDELCEVLRTLIEAIKVIAHLYEPFMPKTSAEALARIGVELATSTDCSLTEEEAAADDLRELCAWGQVAPGTPVVIGDPLFPRLDAKAL